MNNRIFFLAVLCVMSSCTFIPNRMFKVPKDYEFATDTAQYQKGPYIIQIDDRFDLNVFSNEGFRLVDVTTTNLQQLSASDNIEYTIDENGETKLPVVGRVYLRGLSIKEAEKVLEERYRKYYKDPFVLIRVTSRHVLVFHGDGGKGTVVPLVDDHTTLFEALAGAGGLSEFSKAKRIRIIRGDPKNPKVYQADVSSIDGLKTSELQVYPNDIIFVDSGGGFSKRLTSEFLPYMSFLASALVLITYFQD